MTNMCFFSGTLLKIKQSPKVPVHYVGLLSANELFACHNKIKLIKFIINHIIYYYVLVLKKLASSNVITFSEIIPYPLHSKFLSLLIRPKE